MRYKMNATEPARIPVVIGITRPVTIFGIAYNMAIAIMFATTTLWLLTDSFYSFLALPFFYSIVFSISLYDIRYMDMIVIKFQKTPTNRNYWFWRSNSYGV